MLLESYHFIINFVEMDLAHLINYIFALKCDETETCKEKEKIY